MSVGETSDSNSVQGGHGRGGDSPAQLAVGPKNLGPLALAVASASCIMLVFVASLVLQPWPDALFRTDFAAFWTGASLLREGAGANLYDLDQQHAFQVAQRQQQTTAESIRSARGSLPFLNPPPLAVLLLPLTALPMPWAYLILSFLSLLAIVAALALPLRGRPWASASVLAMLSFTAVGDTLLLGRVDGLLLLALSLALLALSAGRSFTGGMLLGLLWLKPQYAVLFPLVLLARRRWRELAGAALTGSLLAGLSLALVGLDGMARYLAVLNQMGTFHVPRSLVANTQMMVNWRAVLVHAWPGIPESVGAALVLALGAATAVAALAAWRGPWDPSSRRFACQMLVTVLATIVAAPHSHFNGTLLLLAPLAMVIARPGPRTGLRGPSSRVWTLVLAVGYLLGLALWVLLDLRWLMVPYFLAAMGLLIRQLWAERDLVGGPWGRRG